MQSKTSENEVMITNKNNDEAVKINDEVRQTKLMNRKPLKGIRRLEKKTTDKTQPTKFTPKFMSTPDKSENDAKSINLSPIKWKIKFCDEVTNVDTIVDEISIQLMNQNLNVNSEVNKSKTHIQVDSNVDQNWQIRA